MSVDVAKTLSAPDYVVFAVTLLISAAIGIYFAIRDRKSQEGTEGYLVGGRSMKMIPVGLSMAVSTLSAVTLLGSPAEMYTFGIMYRWISVTTVIGCAITSEVFIPIYYKLKISSVFEYLELRFNRLVRLLATLGYLIQSALYLGVVIYAPSLALNAVTGFDLWGAILSTGLICIFYTSLGGLKAVVWTDAFQAFVILSGLLAILINGSIEQGGFERIWKTCEEGGRTDFWQIELDPRYRHTVWTILFAGSFFVLQGYAVNQAQVQRYVACKTLRQAKGSLFMNMITLITIDILTVMVGATIYAKYHDCDPMLNGKITALDQLLPYITLDYFHNYPGVSGLIVSCIYSGALSTVSSGISGMTCATIQDFVKPFTKWSERKYLWFSKGLVVVFGAICIAVAFLASLLGDLRQTGFTIISLINGPLLGLFSLGILFPFANSLGAFLGLLSGITMTVWLFLGKRLYPADPHFARRLPLRTNGCDETISNTTQSFTSSVEITTTSMITGHFTEDFSDQSYPAIADFYAISYLYYCFVGFSGCMIVGIIASLISGGWKQRKQVNPALLHFFFDHWSLTWLPKSFRKWMRCGVKKEQETHFEKESPAEKSDFNLSLNEKNLPCPHESIKEAYAIHSESGKSCTNSNEIEEYTFL